MKERNGGAVVWRGTCSCKAVVTVKCPSHDPGHASREFDINCPNCGASELYMRKVETNGRKAE